MAASTAPAAKAKIVELLMARPGLSGVTVTWAQPTEDDFYATGDNVWLGKVTQSEEHIALGGMRKDEDYTVGLWVQSWREGDDPQAVEERAWELRDEAAAAIRADPDLSGILNQWVEFESTEMVTEAFDKGWVAKGECGVLCHART
jgi:hypothetical protein